MSTNSELSGKVSFRPPHTRCDPSPENGTPPLRQKDCAGKVRRHSMPSAGPEKCPDSAGKFPRNGAEERATGGILPAARGTGYPSKKYRRFDWIDRGRPGPGGTVKYPDTRRGGEWCLVRAPHSGVPGEKHTSTAQTKYRPGLILP